MGINLSNMVKLQCQFSFSNHFHMWNFFSESMRTLIFLQVRSHTYIFLHRYISLLCLHTEPNMDNHSPNRQVSTKKSHNRVAAGEMRQPDYILFKTKSGVSPLACQHDRRNPCNRLGMALLAFWRDHGRASCLDCCHNHRSWSLSFLIIGIIGIIG